MQQTGQDGSEMQQPIEKWSTKSTRRIQVLEIFALQKQQTLAHDLVVTTR